MGACAASPRRKRPGFWSRGGRGRHAALFSPRRKLAKFWMRRLMEVIASNRVDLRPLGRRVEGCHHSLTWGEQRRMRMRGQDREGVVDALHYHPCTGELDESLCCRRVELRRAPMSRLGCWEPPVEDLALPKSVESRNLSVKKAVVRQTSVMYWCQTKLGNGDGR